MLRSVGPFRRTMIGLGVALALIVLATLLWQRFGPTRVVLVNYPDFQAARIAREAQGPWVRVQRVDTQQLQKAEGAGLVLVFGRGLALDQDERAALRRLAADTPLLMEASTDPAMDLTNLKGRHLDAVSTYLSQGGASNYASVLAYVRREMQGRLGGPQPEPPQTIPLDVLFHIGDQNIFPSVEAFEDYAAEAGLFQPEAPRVALLTSVPGPFNSNREHVDGLIQAMQERQWNVYPVAAFTGRLSLLQAINPDLVLYMPHGRLTLDQAAEAREWLKSRNIPLLTPLAVFQDEQEWRRDAQGFAGPLLTMSLALPELDGAVAPFVVAAQNTDAAGYQVFTPLPQRMQRFLDLAEGYLRLKSRPKAEQKLAIVYFKGPGMSALTAGDLEVGPSLYRLLQVLRAQGYTVEGLPATFDDFQDLLHSQGRVLAPYAAGEQAAFFAEADPARVSVPTYRTWCAQAGIQSNCEAVDAHYGSAPGQYLVSPEGEIGVARLQFGNVVLLPQPLAGIGEDTFQLVHGANAPPPHPYVASYLWARFGFGADALMHFGTHGSLEFTPGKQVALSSADWADALVGDLPHVYLYTMSNVGEAIIAKRRTYATIVSHLTPPLREAGLRSELGALAQSLQALQSADEVLASEYRQQARKLAVSTGLASDLDLPDGPWETGDWRRLRNHVERLRSERISIGLHTLGAPYSEEALAEMLQLASAEALAQALAELELSRGTVSADALEDAQFTTQRYRQASRELVQRRLAGADLDTLLSAWVSSAERDLLRREEEDLAGPSAEELIRNFVGMAQASGEAPSPVAGSAPVSLAQLEAWVVQALAVPAEQEFLQSLESDKAFERASKTLDPVQLDKVRTIAKAIPPMARALEVATQPHIRGLLAAMQEASLRQQVLALLQDPALEQRVRSAKQAQEAQKLKALEAQIPMLRRLDDIGSLDAEALQGLAQTLRQIADQEAIAARSQDPVLKELASVEAHERALHRVEASLRGLQEERRQYRQAVLRLEQILEAVPELDAGLRRSPMAEVKGLLRAFSGGFVEPSVGGDPIQSPEAVPVGRNMYSVDAEKTPTVAAQRVGAQLGQALLDAHRAKHEGAYPQKVAFTLWPGDFIHTEGAVIAEIFWLLGVEPIRDAFQRVVSLRPIPAEALGRPRVDVVVQTAGQLRDLAASRLYLIEEAVRLAAAQPEEDNALRASLQATESRLKDAGFAPLQAKALAGSRVFGGLNGEYGTAIMGLVERGDRWQEPSQIAQTYLNNMGASYGSSERWMQHSPKLFAAVLEGTDALVQPRDSNTWGALSLDHVYEFMGGLSRAIEEVNGEGVEAYFDDFRQPGRPKVSSLEETISIESRATVLNPDYLKGLAAGGASSAGVLAEITRNAYGWESMRPETIPERYWHEFMDMVVRDREQLGLQAFFERENPYALQEITAVMLETARKGLWQASPEQVAELAERHAQNVAEFGPSCTGFTCGNRALKAFIEQALEAGAARAYAQSIDAQVLGTQASAGVVLRKDSAAPTVLAQGENNSRHSSAGPTPEEARAADRSLPLRVLGLGGFAFVLLAGLLLARRRRPA